MHVRHPQPIAAKRADVPSSTTRDPRPHWSSQTRRASQLISLSDLENDFINPHDASAQINAWVVRHDPNLLCKKWTFMTLSPPCLPFKIEAVRRADA